MHAKLRPVSCALRSPSSRAIGQCVARTAMGASAANACRSSRRIGRGAFSVIELAIVITIVGILFALILPAIEASSESAREQTCQNNLKQLGMAARNHLESWRFFPSGGWGWRWAGDPNRGFGIPQPGGWIYSLLPYLEEKPLWSAGAGISFTEYPDVMQDALAAQVSKPLSVLICPSRRAVALYPYGAARPPWNLNRADLKKGVVKTDYAINVGDVGPNQYPGPNSIRDGDDSAKYRWPPKCGFTGISFERSEVTTKQVTDGLSHTYLAAEKYLQSSKYTTGHDLGDNEAATQGFDNDMCRIAGVGSAPMQDKADEARTDIFGSAHPKGFNAVFCDGSVHMIDYNIDPVVDGHLANRADGQSTDSAAIH